MAASGNDLFFITGVEVAGQLTAGVAEYTTDGVLVNPSVVSGLVGTQFHLAVSGNDLYIYSLDNQLLSNVPITISEYTTDGVPINVPLYTGPASNFTVDSVPEPASVLLAAIGLLGLILLAGWRRRQSSAPNRLG